MAMLSESQSSNLSSSRLQSLQAPTMTVIQEVTKKIRIKIPTKKVESERGKRSCEFGQQVVVLDECSHSIPAGGNKISMINKSHEFVRCSLDEAKRSIAPTNLIIKLPVPGSRKRREPSGISEFQNEKRQKMDRNVSSQCGKILKTLMRHPCSWGFLIPVDPVALGIPDYFSIISHPMDLGTVKSKLQNNEYFDPEEFAADVRLTFSNGMTYNPPHNKFHQMAKELDNVFKRSWKSLEAKWGHERKSVKQGLCGNEMVEIAEDLQKANQKISQVRVIMPRKTLLSSDENKKLRNDLAEAVRGKMTEQLKSFLQRIGLKWSEETIEKDIGSLDKKSVCELKRLLNGSLNAREPKMEPVKMTQNSAYSLAGKALPKDGGSRSACCFAKTKLPSSLVNYKCGSCGGVTCQCNLRNEAVNASSSDSSSEKSFGRDCGVSKRDSEIKEKLTFHVSKPDPDSDGAISTFDEEHFLSSPRQSTPAKAATSGEGWSSLIDVQLSPKKALRAAMLKSRFADTIFKARQKTLLDHGEADPVKMQEEKERLEKQQREETAKIEAQIRAAAAASRLRAESELKLQREREREAARIALEKMQRTVDIDENQVILKDLEMLIERSRADNCFEVEFGLEGLGSVDGGGRVGKPLERLGLFIKEDYCIADVYEDDGEETILRIDGEEGEILL